LDEREVLAGHIRDLASRTRGNDYLTYTGFLSLEEQSFVQTLLRGDAFAGTERLLTGGYPEADRRVLLFLPTYMDREMAASSAGEADGGILPFVCLRVEPLNARFTDHPGHRDYLGALMHLGIRREMVGDILPGEDGAFLFVMKSVADTVQEELTQVRHTTVTVRQVPASHCRAGIRTQEIRGSIASERIDALLAMTFRLSRAAAQQLIGKELVYAGGVLVTGASYTPREGERISVRGYGKFVYRGCEGSTRKGRLIARVQLFV
jgi:RNA-binding protein YlmH